MVVVWFQAKLSNDLDDEIEKYSGSTENVG